MNSDRLVLLLRLEINSYILEERDKEIVVKLQLTFSIQDGLGRDRRKDSEW